MENGQLETIEIEVVRLAEKIGVADGVNESATMGGGHARLIPMHASGCFRDSYGDEQGMGNG